MLTFKSLPRNPLIDFSFITVTNGPDAAGCRTQARCQECQGNLLAYARANPGVDQFGNPGHGNYAHMTQLAVQDKLDTRFNLIANKGAPQMITEHAVGQIDAVIDLTGGYLTQIKAGKPRALAVIGNKRIEQLPDVPMMRELGLDFTAEPWYAMRVRRAFRRTLFAR